jgi:hypothetical protein
MALKCFIVQAPGATIFTTLYFMFQYGNTLTTIVVVQYSELVQTAKDLGPML